MKIGIYKKSTKCTKEKAIGYDENLNHFHYLIIFTILFRKSNPLCSLHFASFLVIIDYTLGSTSMKAIWTKI